MMRFERELKSYAEPVTSAQLKEGSVYFFVDFVDSQLLIPNMETVVFVGRNFEPDDEGRVYFQDIYSYRRGIRWDMPDPPEELDAEFRVGSEDELGAVFEYEQALDQLLVCALRRQRLGEPTA